MENFGLIREEPKGIQYFCGMGGPGGVEMVENFDVLSAHKKST